MQAAGAPPNRRRAGVWIVRLTEPAAAIVDRADRRTARLVSTLLLLLAPLGLVSAVLQSVGAGVGGSQVVVVIAVALIAATYGLSRTRHFRVAGALTSLIPTAAGILVLTFDSADPGWFAFMALNPALGTLLVPIGWSVVLAAINQASVAVCVMVVDGLDDDLAIVAVMFNAIVSVVLITAAAFRNRLERDRQVDLVERRRLHDAILAGTFGGIAVVHDGVITEANDLFAGLFGTAQADLRGRRADELFDPDVYVALRDAAASNSGAPFEAEARRHDGTTFHAEVLVRPIDGNPGADVVAIRDITRRKERSEALQRAQRMEALGRLAAGLAHDTNNQLMIISAAADALEYEHRGAGRSSPAFDQIRHAARHVTTLIRRVVLIGRTADDEPRAVDTADFVEASRPIWEQAVGRGVELDVRVDDPGVVEIDRTRLEQLLLNLILNARDAVGRSGRISVEVTAVDLVGPPDSGPPARPGRYQRICVTDDGDGIAADDLPRIFDPFFTTKDDLGTGLGLYTSHEIVRNCGGAIEVDTGPDGTTMIVLLPLRTTSLPDA